MSLSIATLAVLDGADFFSSIGKIYVVVAVIAIIFIGMIIYLRKLDVKATKLEQHLDNGKT